MSGLYGAATDVLESTAAVSSSSIAAQGIDVEGPRLAAQETYESARHLQQYLMSYEYTPTDIAHLLWISLNNITTNFTLDQGQPLEHKIYFGLNRYILPPVTQYANLSSAQYLQEYLTKFFKHSHVNQHPPEELIIPYNPGHHWVVLKAKIPKEIDQEIQITYLDSLNSETGFVQLDALYSFGSTLGSSYPGKNVKCHHEIGYIQPDSYACGVLTVEHIKQLWEGKTISSSVYLPEDILKLRVDHVTQLLQHGLTLDVAHSVNLSTDSKGVLINADVNQDISFTGLQLHHKDNLEQLMLGGKTVSLNDCLLQVNGPLSLVSNHQKSNGMSIQVDQKSVIQSNSLHVVSSDVGAKVELNGTIEISSSNLEMKSRGDMVIEAMGDVVLNEQVLHRHLSVATPGTLVIKGDTIIKGDCILAAQHIEFLGSVTILGRLFITTNTFNTRRRLSAGMLDLRYCRRWENGGSVLLHHLYTDIDSQLSADDALIRNEGTLHVVNKFKLTRRLEQNGMFYADNDMDIAANIHNKGQMILKGTAIFLSVPMFMFNEGSLTVGSAVSNPAETQLQFYNSGVFESKGTAVLSTISCENDQRGEIIIDGILALYSLSDTFRNRGILKTTNALKIKGKGAYLGGTIDVGAEFNACLEEGLSILTKDFHIRGDFKYVGMQKYSHLYVKSDIILGGKVRVDTRYYHQKGSVTQSHEGWKSYVGLTVNDLRAGNWYQKGNITTSGSIIVSVNNDAEIEGVIRSIDAAALLYVQGKLSGNIHVQGATQARLHVGGDLVGRVPC